LVRRGSRFAAPCDQRSPNLVTSALQEDLLRMYEFSGAARISVLTIALTVCARIAVAQTAILYEEVPSDRYGKRYDGTVSWRLENAPADSAQPVEAAICGEIIIPEHQMKVTLTIRRDTDRGSSASHLILTQFTVPADFSHGGVQEVRAILMKDSEKTRGIQLAGLSVKVNPSLFLVGLCGSKRQFVRRAWMVRHCLHV
jgi:hypothetical protein